MALSSQPYASCFRSLEDGMAIDSRYLATVRRATLIPCPFNIEASLLSLKGLVELSVAMSFLSNARIAIEDASPPVSVATWLEKKNLILWN